MSKQITIAVIDCSVPINTRNQKIIDSLKKTYPQSVIHIISWNREGVEMNINNNFHSYEKKAAYADAYAKLKGLFGYRNYIKKTITEINPDVIIASHWSNLMLVSDFKKTNQILIYENLDIPTGKFPIRYISSTVEKWSLKKVDLIIHASRFFRSLYPDSIPQIILENKPLFKPYSKNKATGKPLKIAFIGSVRYKEILINLCDAVRNNPAFELYFHGSGEDLKFMKEYCSNVQNIYFTGKYEYSKIIALYHQSDIIWAAYPNKDYNVVYAISNKFHESLYVGVPCIFSENTKLADFVKDNRIGLVVDPYNPANIKQLFSDIVNGKVNIENIQESMELFQSKESTWDEDFKQLIDFINVKSKS